MDCQSLKRPKPNETEEDLLKFQEEFLKSRGTTSSSVVDVRDAKGNQNDKRSLNETRELKKVKFDVDVEHKEDSDSFTSFKVVERDTTCYKVTLPKKIIPSFPKTFRIKNQADGASSKHSIFAQQMRMRKTKAQETSKQTENIQMDIDNNEQPSGFNYKSSIVDGSGLTDGQNKESIVKEIHEENVKKIAEMPIEDVLKTREMLMKTLDPNVVEFLKSKKKSIPKEKDTKMDVDSTPPPEKPNNSSFILERDLKEEELPINPSKAKQWLHMDDVEKEKLAWMTNIPEPIDGNHGNIARFDFDGNLAVNAVHEFHEGLHHHGEEPEVPGYTLEELFRFSRSSMASQKVLGLGTLTKILSKIQEGCYDEVLRRPLLPDLVAGNIVPLFRFALDDNSPQIISVAVAAVHSLIVSVPDELSLDETFLWYRGEEQPFSQVELKDTDKTSDEELSDDAIVDLDIIKGLLRMDLLSRLRYILEIIRPSAPVVIHILEMLAKIARHSVESAKLIIDAPRLLSVLLMEFCPKSWHNVVGNQCLEGKLISVYGVPTYQAVKVVRNLASSGRLIAVHLLSNFDIMNSLLCYLSSGYRDHQLPAKEAMLLCLESIHAWQVFLSYGLTLDSYTDFYPMLLRQLVCFQNISINVDAEQHCYDCDYAASWIKLLSVLLKRTKVEDSSICLEWEKVSGIIDYIELCLSKWMWEVTTCTVNRVSSRLIATSLNFVSTFYKMYSKQPCYNSEVVFQRIQKLFTKSLAPFMSSQFFRDVLCGLKKFSTLRKNVSTNVCRDSDNLPSLNSVLWGGIVAPILEPDSPFAITIDLVRCLCTFIQLHANLADEVSALLLENPGTLAYLSTVVLGDVERCWFLRFEALLIYHLIKLCALKNCTHMSLYHSASLKLMHLFKGGEIYLLERLMSLSVFNSSFIRELHDASLALDSLNLKELTESSESEEVSHFQLITTTSKNLPNICSSYKSCLSETFSNFGLNCRSRGKSIFVSHNHKPIIAEDFVYQPLITKYKNQLKLGLSQEKADIDLETIHCLQWCHLLESLKRGLYAPPSAKFCHLSKTFLIASDAFLHPEARRYLKGCFRKMSLKEDLANVNLDISVEGGKFTDFFTQLLDQFEAISYGDHLFGSVVLVTMQRCHCLELRSAIWMERTNALSIIRVTFNELLVPVKYYLDPVEDDENLLASYFKALLNGRVTCQRNPVVYLIAIRHLHGFVFDDVVKPTILKESIISKLLNLQNQTLSHHIQCYAGPDLNAEHGFACTDSPPTHVCRVMEMFSKSR